MKPILAVPFLGVTLLICGCRDDGAASAGARGAAAAPLAPPAPNPARFEGVSCFDIAESDGVLHLLLGRAGGDEDKAVALSYTRSGDGGTTWSAPVPVPMAHAPPARMHRGDDPQIAARGARVMAVWPATGQGPYGSGPIGAAVSEDGGRTWQPAQSPAARPLPNAAIGSPQAAAPAAAAGVAPGAATAVGKNGGAGRHKHAVPATGPGYRFPAVAAGADAFHLVWIYASGEERSLRHARLGFQSPRGSWSKDVVIDPQICACCWNELRVAADGSLCALYRDVKPSDMAMSTSRDGGATWKPAGRPGPFAWQFDGCPHVGGGLAAITGAGAASEWLATVWTGAAKSAGAYATAFRGQRSGSESPRWTQPLPLGDGGRNTDVAFHEPSLTALAVWDQGGGEAGQSVFAAASRDGGRTWGAPRPLSQPGQNAAYPRVVPTRDGFLVAWTVYGTSGTSSLGMRAVRAADILLGLDDREQAVAAAVGTLPSGGHQLHAFRRDPS